MKLNKITPTGKPIEVVVPEEIFATEINKTLIAQAIRVYLSNQRQGTSKAKTRSDVARTKAKWYKQKGTGRARHGSRNAPIFVGGGVAHGPKGVENWHLTMPTKQKLLSLRSALSMQLENTVISDIPLETEGKTKYAKRFVDLLTKKTEEKILLVYKSPEENKIKRAFGNLPKVVIQSARSLTTYQVAGADKIVLTSQGLENLELRLFNKKEDTEISSVTTELVKLSKPAKKVTKSSVSKVTKKISRKSLTTKKPVTKPVTKPVPKK